MMLLHTIPTTWIPATPAWYDGVALPVGKCAYCAMIGHVRRDVRSVETGKCVTACKACAIERVLVPESAHVVEAQLLTIGCQNERMLEYVPMGLNHRKLS